MKRLMIGLASLAAFVASGYSFYYFGVQPGYAENISAWLIFGPALLFLAVGIVLLVWTFDDNIHNITSGKVIGHDFTQAHMSSPTYVPGTPGTSTSPGTPGVFIPGTWQDDEWAIQLEDEQGRTGWLHFSKDVFKQYPIGSHYQAPVE